MLALLATSCGRLLTPAPPRVPLAGVPGVLAMREASLPGLRLSMRVRTRGVSGLAALASPAYLVVEGPEQVHLQVLSPFGVTLFDLVVDGREYHAALPLQGRTRRGTVDLEALARGGVAADERMIVALALLFRQKTVPSACTGATGAEVVCDLGHGIAVTVTVDQHLRPIRERYTGDDGATLLRVTYDRYDGASPTAVPGRIEIRGANDGIALLVRVLHARRRPAPPPT